MIKTTPFTDSELAPFLALKASDTVRGGRIVRSSALLAVREFFSGSREANDKKAFDQFYARMNLTIRNLRKDIERGHPAFDRVQTMLEIAARVENSAWGGDKLRYNTQIDHLIKISKKHITNDVDAKIVRWINAKPEHRRFAVALNLKEVPYRYREIPRGAVLLTDPFLYLKAAEMKKKPFFQTILKTIEVRIKAFFCWLMTGMRYSHAELSLGGGIRWDLDKSPKGFARGEMTIKHTPDNTCYGAIVVPNEDKMLTAHKAAGGTHQTFDELWKAIEKEARDSQLKIKASAWDIAKVAMYYPRFATYDSKAAWAPGAKNYGCSATTSALFSKFGIDIGLEFKKMDMNVSPADFMRSKFFTTLYSV